MLVNVIHNPKRKDRFQLLQKEILHQQLTITYWDAVINPIAVVVGISQAHKQIVRWAKENNLPEVCIAEDDVKFFGRGAFNYFVNNKPKDYDLYLGGIFWGHIAEDNTVGDFTGMTLYIVNERFYDKFLALREFNNIDRELAFKGKYVVCNPMVVSQHEGWSDSKFRFDSYDRLLDGRNLFKGEVGV